MRSDYTKLNRITFIRGPGITLGMIASVFLLRALTGGHLADTIARWIAQGFSMSETQADIVYFKVVTINMQFILGIVIILFAFLLFYMLLHSYRRYSDEVLLGIDKLMEGGDHISLSPELGTVECKLNYAKQTPKTRADEARKMEQQKDNPVVYLAHDIKTSLALVTGYLSLLGESPDMTDDKKVRYVHIVWGRANRLKTLVNGFSEITRGHSEPTVFHKIKIDLYYMLIQILEELYPQPSTCKKHIENNVDENISMYEDSEKLARVSNNILKNAISYSENSNAIPVSVKELPKKTVIRFENKRNIPNDKPNLVFDKFYRLDSARQSDIGGSDFGLAIAEDITTSHGGWIQTESNNGHTAFIIEIPSAVRENLSTAS